MTVISLTEDPLILAHIEADELGQVAVALVFHFLLDADL